MKKVLNFSPAKSVSFIKGLDIKAIKTAMKSLPKTPLVNYNHSSNMGLCTHNFVMNLDKIRS